jgi:GH35 family endo-1,4-beta-xylanase
MYLCKQNQKLLLTIFKMRIFNQTFLSLATSVLCLSPLTMKAQLSSNQDKFLGNITTSYQVDFGNEKYYTLWNQITCENESKWGSVEGTRNSYNWGCDNAFNYAKSHKFPYKFHALVWGSQYPGWIENLSLTDRYAAIEKWYDAVKKKYTTLPLIDVVNEAVEGHQQGTHYMKEALGGGGKTGYDWLVKAFEMAFERWPDAILIYNDFNTFQWNTDQYIDLVRTLRDAGAPIDAYGCQSHDLTDLGFSNFKSVETKIQNALKMPMYSTEYDIGTEDDALQEQRYKEQIPYMWEKDYCAGITLWGYIYGRTWTTNGNSGLIKDGKDRPAMTWLREYMKSDAAKNAKSPYPGMKKRVSVFIRPADLNVAKGDVLPIKVRTYITADAKKENPDIAIQKVDLYVGSSVTSATTLIASMDKEPYIAEYEVPSSSSTGWKVLRAVVTTNDTTYVRFGRINVLSSTVKRQPYGEAATELPGTITVSEYDKGASGVSYSNASRNNAVTKDGAWMEYTVDVKEDGIYSFDAEVASTKTGGMFRITEYGFDNLTFLTSFIEVPMTGSTSDYKIMHGVLKKELTAGRHRLCLNIDKGGFYIKSLTFNRYEEDTKNITVAVSSVKPATVSEGDSTVITVTARSTGSTIANVKLYDNDLLIATLEESPYQFVYYPTGKGNHYITAIATDGEGKMKTSAKKGFKVNVSRSPYNGVINLPGIIQAENFDKGGEGLSFHDSDSNKEGDADYRSDAEGVDFVKGNSGTCIGYTASGEWLDYTVNVTEPGKYSVKATVSSGTTNSGFDIGLTTGSSTNFTKLCSINVPQTANNDWGTYKVVESALSKELAVGKQIIRIKITGANCNIDKMEFICTENTGISQQPIVNSLQPTQLYNLSGQKVNDGYKGIIIRNGRKIFKR